MAEYQGCEIPEDLWYDLDYCWVRPLGEGAFRVGLTDPSQTMAGRLQHVRFRSPGTHRARKKPLARLESGKWAGGVPAPFDGTIVACNGRLLETPHLVNIAPYTDAWIVEMRADDPARALDGLVTGAAAVEGLRAWIDRYGVVCMRCAIGYFAATTVAMVSRVSLGHSGRALEADALTWWAFLGVLATAGVRAAADLWFMPPALRLWLSVAAAVLWLAVFVPWAGRYVPVYLTPRADGRPG